MKLRKRLNLPPVFKLLFLIWFSFRFLVLPVYSSSQGFVDITTKISVCGDLNAEGREECDNDDLSDETCRSLGFDLGSLECDITCDFDTDDCQGVAPTPTPTPTPSSTQTSDQNSSSTPTPTSTPATSVLESLFVIQPEIIVQPIAAYRPLPARIFALDPNNDNKIEKKEIHSVVESWVNNWKQVAFKYQNIQGESQEKSKKELESCDFDGDQKCSFVDLSILLYYIEQ